MFCIPPNADYGYSRRYMLRPMPVLPEPPSQGSTPPAAFVPPATRILRLSKPVTSVNNSAVISNYAAPVLGQSAIISSKTLEPAYTTAFAEHFEPVSGNSYSESSGPSYLQKVPMMLVSSSSNNNNKNDAQSEEDGPFRAFSPFSFSSSSSHSSWSSSSSLSSSCSSPPSSLGSGTDYNNNIPINNSNKIFTKKKAQVSSFRFGCNFCRKNGEPVSAFRSHRLHNPNDGTTECPVLRSLVCDICGETGSNAHTKSYCPYAKGLLPIIEEIGEVGARLNMGDLRNTRFSAAGKRQQEAKNVNNSSIDSSSSKIASINTSSKDELAEAKAAILEKSKLHVPVEYAEKRISMLAELYMNFSSSLSFF